MSPVAAGERVPLAASAHAPGGRGGAAATASAGGEATVGAVAPAGGAGEAGGGMGEAGSPPGNRRNGAGCAGENVELFSR